jgi:hypothetical protein
MIGHTEDETIRAVDSCYEMWIKETYIHYPESRVELAGKKTFFTFMCERFSGLAIQVVWQSTDTPGSISDADARVNNLLTENDELRGSMHGLKKSRRGGKKDGTEIGVCLSCRKRYFQRMILVSTSDIVFPL